MEHVLEERLPLSMTTKLKHNSAVAEFFDSDGIFLFDEKVRYSGISVEDDITCRRTLSVSTTTFVYTF